MTRYRWPSTSAAGAFLIVALASACSATGAGTPVPSSSTNQDVAALRALEGPVLRSVKEATTALLAGNQSVAADALEQIGSASRRILDWLAAHANFARANAAATTCLRETMNDLGEQAEGLAPLLRQGSASPTQLTKLRTDLGEAANCIQSGD